ncbi:carbon-nitrogen hydrolase family protein [Candidatus Micrarchaeota archaeon]|nr:carbon-nitrogen hydrolase family protein [Candidatus Micrarchaeota archaeon]
MKICLVQTAVKDCEVPQNIAAAKELSFSQDAEVYLFPELFCAGSPIEDASRFAEDEKGATISFLYELSRAKKAYTIGSYIEKDGNSLYKTAVVFDNNSKLICKYRQIHLCSITGETQFFSPGSQMPYFDTFTFRSTNLLSYDLRFPEAAREFGLSWGFFLFVQGAVKKDESHQWLAFLQARAAENQMYLFGTNRSGGEYAGKSAIFDPDGKEILIAGEKEGAYVAEIDPFRVEWFRLRKQYLTDARKFAYSGTVKASELDPEA